MRASDMTFGIEIECAINRDVSLRVGGYHNGSAVNALPAFNSRSWKAESDSSLYFSDHNKRAIEFVSPILSGAAGLDNIRAACAQIKSWGGITNRTCGLHVHVGIPEDLTMTQLRNLYRLVGRFEDALYAMTGTSERRHSRYCNPIKTPANKSMDWGRIQSKEDLRYGTECSDRYRILNICPFINGRQNTVEFRVFSGSLNPAKIAAWIQICLSLVALAQDGHSDDWDIDTDVLAKRAYGPSWGVKNTRYMCHYLWKWPSRRDRGYGDLEHETFTRRAAEKTLLALAERYDARNNTDTTSA